MEKGTAQYYDGVKGCADFVEWKELLYLTEWSGVHYVVKMGNTSAGAVGRVKAQTPRHLGRKSLPRR